MPAPPYFGSVSDAIYQAYVNAGLIAEGQAPNSERYAAAFNKLNHLVNFLQTKGLKLFTVQDVPLTLVAGTYLYTLGPLGTVPMTKPLRVPFAYFLDQYNSRIPMTAVSQQEWTILPINAAPGIPVNFFVDKQATTLNVNLWPTPNAQAALGSVHLILQTQLPLGTNLTESIYFPPEWFIGVAWALANELCTGQPQAIVARCQQKSEKFLADLEGWDVEDAQTFFTPDVRGSYGGSSFR